MLILIGCSAVQNADEPLFFSWNVASVINRKISYRDSNLRPYLCEVIVVDHQEVEGVVPPHVRVHAREDLERQFT